MTKAEELIEILESIRSAIPRIQREAFEAGYHWADSDFSRLVPSEDKAEFTFDDIRDGFAAYLEQQAEEVG